VISRVLGTASDLALLPESVRLPAVSRSDGVEWRYADAIDAVNALADARKVVVKLFYRFRDSADDLDLEAAAWEDEVDFSLASAENVDRAIESGRAAALDAISRNNSVYGKPTNWIRVCWCDALDFPEYAKERREARARVQAIQDRAAARTARRNEPN
jgi:hypothetical protein